MFFGKLNRLKTKIILRISSYHYWWCMAAAAAVSALFAALTVAFGFSDSEANWASGIIILAICWSSFSVSLRRREYFTRLGKIYWRLRSRTRRQVLFKFLLWLGFAFVFVTIVAPLMTKGMRASPPSSVAPGVPSLGPLSLIFQAVGIVNAFTAVRVALYLFLAFRERRRVRTVGNVAPARHGIVRR